MMMFSHLADFPVTLGCGHEAQAVLVNKQKMHLDGRKQTSYETLLLLLLW